MAHYSPLGGMSGSPGCSYWALIYFLPSFIAVGSGHRTAPFLLGSAWWRARGAAFVSATVFQVLWYPLSFLLLSKICTFGDISRIFLESRLVLSCLGWCVTFFRSGNCTKGSSDIFDAKGMNRKKERPAKSIVVIVEKSYILEE